MDRAETICSRLARVAAERGDRSVQFVSPDATLRYDELNRYAGDVARGIARTGIGRGEPVGLLLPASPEFLAAFFGILRAGAVAVPLPVFGIGTSGRAQHRLRFILENAGIRFLVVPPGTSHTTVLREAVPGAGLLEAQALAADAAGGPPAAPEPGGPALVQYTSGSTSQPKGIALSHANLMAGIAGIVDGAALRPDDLNGQWLPLFHDMGLIGMLAAVSIGMPQVLWQPDAFIRRPGAWLRDFSRRRITCMAAPNFAYARLLSRVTDEELRQVDLRSWRIAINGAEVIDPACIRGFCERFGRVGFSPSAMLPAYGLAEVTLAATFHRSEGPSHVEWVDREALSNERVVRRVAPGAPNARGIVCVGRAVIGHELRVVDADGTPLGRNRVGEIQVRGPAVMAAYYERTPEESGITADGWLETGDLGFLTERGLFVAGRLKEMVVVRGQNYYPQDVEKAVARVEGVYHDTCVAFAVPGASENRMAVVAETALEDPRARFDLVERVHQAILHELGLVGVVVHLVKVHAIARTTSGKLQRILMRQRLLGGQLDSVLLPAAEPEAASPGGVANEA